MSAFKTWNYFHFYRDMSPYEPQKTTHNRMGDTSPSRPTPGTPGGPVPPVPYSAQFMRSRKMFDKGPSLVKDSLVRDYVGLLLCLDPYSLFNTTLRNFRE